MSGQTATKQSNNKVSEKLKKFQLCGEYLDYHLIL